MNIILRRRNLKPNELSNYNKPLDKPTINDLDYKRSKLQASLGITKIY